MRERGLGLGSGSPYGSLRLDANFFSCPILIWCSAQKVVAGPHTNRSVAHIKIFIQMCTHAALGYDSTERALKTFECNFSNMKSTFHTRTSKYHRLVDIPNHQTVYIQKCYSDPQLAFPLGRDEIAIIVVEIRSV